MGLGRTPFFHGLKKQASYFFKETIRMARLALTDVTPAELLTKAATDRNSRIPDTKTMTLISRAAFEIEDYWRIVAILHRRLSRFKKKHWIKSYKALILLEYILTHGPKSTAAEFQGDRDDIKKLGSFQYVDKRGRNGQTQFLKFTVRSPQFALHLFYIITDEGNLCRFNCGLAVRNKTERILQLLGNEYLLKEERNRIRQLTYGIEGSWSFGQQSLETPDKVIQHESCSESCWKISSRFGEDSQQGDSLSSAQKNLPEDKGHQIEHFVTWENFDEVQMSIKTKSVRSSLKSNLHHQSSSNMIEANTSLTSHFPRELHDWDNELKPLLDSHKTKREGAYG